MIGPLNFDHSQPSSPYVESSTQAKQDVRDCLARHKQEVVFSPCCNIFSQLSPNQKLSALRVVNLNSDGFSRGCDAHKGFNRAHAVVM